MYIHSLHRVILISSTGLSTWPRITEMDVVSFRDDVVRNFGFDFFMLDQFLCRPA